MHTEILLPEYAPADYAGRAKLWNAVEKIERIAGCCFHDTGGGLNREYAVLKDGAEIVCPIGECPFSPLMFALTDKFVVQWCVFE